MARRSTSGRVTKRATSSSSRSGARNRMSAKRKGKLAIEASSSDGGVTLQKTVDKVTEKDHVPERSHVNGTAMSGGSQDDEDLAMYTESPDSPNQHAYNMDLLEKKEHEAFPLMQLPAEIRNEIYRACLTRPFNILLSRKEPPQIWEAEPEAQAQAPRGDVIDLTVTDSDSEDPATSVHIDSRLRQVQTAPASTFASRYLPYQAARLASRGARTIRFLNRPSSPSATSGATGVSNPGGFVINRARPRSSRSANHARTKPDPPREPRPQDEDPLITNLLRVSKAVYQEARSILYNENLFTVNLFTAGPTLAALHQRSRRQIKHVELEIPCYNEILEKFQETVRLSLRYCWGLRKLVIHMPFTLPGLENSATGTSNTTVYANGFDILRWLPRQCHVVLSGNVCAEIEAVVSKNAKLAKTLDEDCYVLVKGV